MTYFQGILPTCPHAENIRVLPLAVGNRYTLNIAVVDRIENIPMLWVNAPHRSVDCHGDNGTDDRSKTFPIGTAAPRRNGQCRFGTHNNRLRMTILSVLLGFAVAVLNGKFRAQVQAAQT